MYGFDKTRTIAAVVRVLNSNYDLIATVGRYLKVEDIENIETWYIGIRVKFCQGIVPRRRFMMVSKTKVCAKSAPRSGEVTFARDGKLVSDRLHLSTYKYTHDDSGIEYTWTVCFGFNTKRECQQMQDRLWLENMAAHSVVRRAERTKCSWELKVWEVHPKLLESCMNNKTISVYKPNGSYRFMIGDEVIVAVASKKELQYAITKYISQGYQIQLHDPATKAIYQAKLVDGQVKYSCV